MLVDTKSGNRSRVGGGPCPGCEGVSTQAATDVVALESAIAEAWRSMEYRELKHCTGLCAQLVQ